MKKTGLYKFAQTVLPPIFKVLYRYQVIGRENIPGDGSLLLCSNHTSYKDPIFMGIVQRRQVYFMAKKELFKSKFLSKLISMLGAFPVERAGGISAIKKGIDILEDNGVVGLFIEGTRSKTGELLKPKPGAIMLASETDSTIVPMAIIGKDGKPPKVFRRAYINIGKPLSVADLGLTENTGMALRQASRVVMEKIKVLRDEVLDGTADGKAAKGA